MPMILAPYACLPQESRGRLHHEDSCFMRDPLQRDRDRIIHSAAFRRLKHKSQVFIANEGEYYRTRLTHSMEVSQIARGISRHFCLNEDLAESISLAHDFGHPPFGHAGEDALIEAMKDLGGFNHNDQTIRILTSLEKKYPLFPGLNLSWETLEGLVKHNGPIHGGLAQNPALRSIFKLNEIFPLELETFASAEAQIAALCDDIAYNSHDIDDGFQAGLFSLRELEDVPIVGSIIKAVVSTYPDIQPIILVQEVIRRLINYFVKDMSYETKERLNESKASCAHDIRALKSPVAALSSKGSRDLASIKEFLFKAMYSHPTVAQMKAIGRSIVRDLFTTQKHQHFQPDNLLFLESVCDHIAQLTDLEALQQHEKLTGKKYVSPFTSVKR